MTPYTLDHIDDINWRITWMGHRCCGHESCGSSPQWGPAKVLPSTGKGNVRFFFLLYCHSALLSAPSAAGSANPDQVFKLEVFQGEFLDIRSVINLKVRYRRSPIPRSSAVFGVFLAIGAFLFAAIRAYYRPLIFMSIFGTIAIDVFCVCRPHSHLFFLMPP